MTPSVPRLLLWFLIAIAIVPGVAQADSGLPQVPVPASDALTTTAHALAVAHWGVDPCAGQVTVTWAHMGAGINARSTWMSYDIHNPATYSQCAISYNLDVDWDWPKLCTVIEHELGHLAGQELVEHPAEDGVGVAALHAAEGGEGGLPLADAAALEDVGEQPQGDGRVEPREQAAGGGADRLGRVGDRLLDRLRPAGG